MNFHAILAEAAGHVEKSGDTFGINVLYLIACAAFILSLKWLGSPETARKGVTTGMIGMGLAVLGALFREHYSNYTWIAIGIGGGVIAGIPLARVALTAVPQRTAFSHAFGGLAAALVGTVHYFLELGALTHFEMAALIAEVILGYLTFTGSLMAMFKLQEIIIPTRPVTFPNQRPINFGMFGAAALLGVLLVYNPGWWPLFIPIILLSLAFGVALILPIGGADMPTVISILNSFAGLSAVAMGFVLNSKLLITAGALDGSSGLILSWIMCKAMNRSFWNVLFGAFGQVKAHTGTVEQKPIRSASAEDAASILAASGSLIIIPGYGMAVAQAQHKVRELYDALTKRGVDVKFAIHPVAGRMPGHMNVLLAEADIPYDKLIEMDEINPEFAHTDVALVIGANDVTNPAARHDKNSPIYGMPILDVDKARTVMVIKRSMNPGFAGIDNELYYLDRTMMLFGDAKSFVGEIVKELGSQH